MLQKIKRKLFADVYEKVDLAEKTVDQAREIINQYYALIEKQTLSEKTLNIDEVAILGGINNCNITVKPQVHNRIILSEAKFSAALGIEGNNQYVGNCHFQSYDTAIEAKTGDIE